MADQRVSMFVSHKMDSYGRAAHRIKAILESRTERLDVDICEETFAGDRWRKWVTDHIKKSEILLVLWPHTDDKDDPQVDSPRKRTIPSALSRPSAGGLKASISSNP